MNEFVRGAPGFRGWKREIDHQGPAHDVGPGDKSPIAAVQAVVTIVAHHKIMVRWHHQLAAIHVIREFISPVAVHVPGIAAQIGEIITISIRHPLLVHRIIFLKKLAISLEYLVPPNGGGPWPFHYTFSH